ncbi:MAG: acetylxylan esterase [Paludibacteraceae bacterium]
MTLLPGEKMDKRKLYQVSMKSVGNVEIPGYDCVPIKIGKYPTIISYMGYGSKPWSPKPDNNLNYAEFVLSFRGQSLNEPTNIYGDWITYELGNKDKYYYRGAIVDLIRAIDFAESRPEVDNPNIFAGCGSQGCAFTLVACALDNYKAATVHFIPFYPIIPIILILCIDQLNQSEKTSRTGAV